MTDSVMYDSPLEFMQEAANSDACVAQSVIPTGNGEYTVACSCERWETTAPSIEEGLRLARVHTGSEVEGYRRTTGGPWADPGGSGSLTPTREG